MEQKSTQGHREFKIKLSTEAEDNKKQVLLCDDEQELDLMSDVLGELGNIDVSYAHDGEEALDKLQNPNYDAIITDLNMPKVNGMQLIQKIKTDPNHQFTPLYICRVERWTKSSRSTQTKTLSPFSASHSTPIS